jgi:chitin disaccharide deacetylase
MTHFLIVNADDYGLTPGVSAGIRRAHLQGIVTSTTAMMNQPYVQEELPSAQEQCPRLGIGVHLTLTVGKPLLPARLVPSLVDENGAFFRQEAFIHHLPQVNPDEALEEWRTQVETFVRVTRCKPDHLDSHHHSSYFTPPLFERMLQLSAEYDLPIRKPFGENSASAADYLPGGQPAEDFIAVEKLLQKFKPKCTQAFSGDFYDETANLPALQQLFDRIADSQQQSWELMCHPAEVDDPLRAISSYSEPRSRELLALTQSQLPAWLSIHKIELTSFGKLIY